MLFLDDPTRARLLPLLGGRAAWDSDSEVLAHGQLTCERFASTFAWSFWSSSDNSMKPEGRYDESAAMAPKRFRELIGRPVAEALARRTASPPASPDDSAREAHVGALAPY